MNYKLITKYFIFVSLAAILVFDGWVWSNGGTEATISWAIFAASYDYPLIPFFAGFVCGHFFWQMKPKLKMGKTDELG